MAQHDDPIHKDYPLGRGYGHDYMRGGEVFGGYGYSERDEYELPRGELTRDSKSNENAENAENADDSASGHTPGS
jgi:hypothetical protein